MGTEINLYLQIAKEVEYLNMKYNLSFEAALRLAKEKYKGKIKEAHAPTNQGKDHEQKLYNEILTLKKNIGNRR